jgi:alpha-L-fucosidase 2
MKNTFLLLVCCLFVMSAGNIEASKKNTNELKLYYQQPAGEWTEALPLGNGRLGAMVFGTVEQEHIQFNEETLWTGEPRIYANPDAHLYLKDIQRLLFEGKQREAEILAQVNFMGNPLNQRSYQPFGDLYLAFPGHEKYSDYKRELDLKQALHKVSYKVDGVTYTREMLISKPDEVMAVKLGNDKGKAFDFSFWLDAEHEKKSVVANGSVIQLDVAVSKKNDNPKDLCKSVLFGTSKVKIDTDGTITQEEGKITVKGASRAVLYLTAATNYKNYKDVSNKPLEIVDGILSKINNKPYAEVKKEHIADYSPLFNRFEIDFGQNKKQGLPTDQRLINFNDSKGDPGFVALYVQFGRYLMLTSSREGTNAANLQGIWNKDIQPAWDSKYTANINVEMNYWLPEVANLTECHEPMFKLVEEVAESGSLTAKMHYDADGWCLHHNTDIWRGTAPIYASNHGIFLGSAGWFSHHMWEHYLFTQDEQFLKERAYPVMKGAASFYNDLLVKDPKTGWLVSSPSNSPETGGLVYGPSMDHQIIRSLFKACIQSSEILGVDADFAKELKDKLKNIAPDQIGQHGQLQEWVEDKDDINSKHRHVSHLWGVHPGNEINWDSPEMMKAAIQSLRYRGDDGTGWSLAWKINFWARFLDGDHAYELIKMLFRPVTTNNTTYGAGGGSYLNLFDAHPPFQIDGNFGAPTGILEMLLQSQTEYLHILPALPSALAEGKIKGICARGGFELDFTWEKGKLKTISIKSKAGKKCKVKYNDKVVEFDTEKGKVYQLNSQLEQI